MEEQELEEGKFEILIEHKNRILRYRFTDLEVEQGELCREIGEFKHTQIQNPASNLNEHIKSKGVDWLSWISAYLFKEIIKDEPKDFNKSFSENEILPFIKKLPISEYAKLEVAVKDFFTNIGNGVIGLALFQKEKSRSETEKLQMLMMLMNMNPNSNPNVTQEN